MLKRIIAFLLCAVLLMGCSPAEILEPEYQTGTDHLAMEFIVGSADASGESETEQATISLIPTI